MTGNRYFPFVMVFFVAILMISNITASKVIYLWGVSLTGATLIFPISYIFGDVLTEVYGYRRSRVVIWTGFAVNILMAFIFWMVGMIPADPYWVQQGGPAHWEFILGQTPRIVLGSLVAYWVGSFMNSYVLAKLKVATGGKWLWSRTIGSTVIGEAIDTAVFVTVAFAGVLPTELVRTIILSNYVVKVGVEVFFTPITYAVVRWLKVAEGCDVFDRHTDFNPFHLEIEVAATSDGDRR